MAPIRTRQRRTSVVVNARRRSSIAALANLKGVNFSSSGPSPRALTFAPNVTPSNFTEDTDEWEDLDDAAIATIFPPSEASTSAPKPRTARRKHSEGHIPRPPNAFMIFRADFVKQKHVPGSIETTHSTLSKIIGTCWRALPLEEKRVWELKAKQAKQEHKLKHPDYRFRPVHTKGRKVKATKAAASPDEERRVDEVANLLLEGRRGDELASAVKRYDLSHQSSPIDAPHHGYPMAHHHQAPMSLPPPGYFAEHRYLRRSSSVPPPSHFAPQQQPQPPIMVPSLGPFLMHHSRPESPVHNIARQAAGHRRASSVQPIPAPSWLEPPQHQLTLSREQSPLPEADTSMFEPAYLQGTGFAPNPNYSFNPHFGFSPLEGIAPHEIPASSTPGSTFDPLAFYAHPLAPHAPASGGSQPSTAYSGSPTPSDLALPVYAPRPQHAGPAPDFGAFAFGAGAAPAAPGPFDGFAFGHAAQQQAQQHHQHQAQHHQCTPGEIAGAFGGFAQQDASGPMAYYGAEQTLPQQQTAGAFFFPADAGSFDVNQYINMDS